MKDKLFSRLEVEAEADEYELPDVDWSKVPGAEEMKKILEDRKKALRQEIETELLNDVGIQVRKVTDIDAVMLTTEGATAFLGVVDSAAFRLETALRVPMRKMFRAELQNALEAYLRHQQPVEMTAQDRQALVGLAVGLISVLET